MSDHFPSLIAHRSGVRLYDSWGRRFFCCLAHRAKNCVFLLLQIFGDGVWLSRDLLSRGSLLYLCVLGVYCLMVFSMMKKKGTSRQRSGKGAIRKRFPLQKPRWEKTKLTIRYLYHETYKL